LRLRGWKTQTVADVCDRVSVGIVVKPSQYYVEASDGIRAFRSANVGLGKVVDQDWVYISHKGHNANKKSELKAGDVLVVRTGAPGTACVLPKEFCGSNCIDIVFARPDQSQILPDYLAALTNSAVGRRHVGGNISGLAQKHFNVGAYKELIIDLPPLPEQRRIAEILRTWDEAIEKLEALRAAKERRFYALREKLIRRGMANGSPTSFGSFLTESRVAGSDGATAKKITVKLYGLGAVAKENERGGGSANTKYYRRSAGQLVYSKLDFLNGAFAIVPPNLDGYETTLDLPAFDIDAKMNAEWLLHYLIRPEYYSNQTEMARGQRKARRISPTEFLASDIHLPPRVEQDKAVSILQAAIQDTEATDREITALQRQKRGLMQKLLTGEWRVSVDETAEAAQ